MQQGQRELKPQQEWESKILSSNQQVKRSQVYSDYYQPYGEDKVGLSLASFTDEDSGKEECDDDAGEVEHTLRLRVQAKFSDYYPLYLFRSRNLIPTINKHVRFEFVR